MNPRKSFTREGVCVGGERGAYLLDGEVAVAAGGPDGLQRGAEALGAQHARGGDRVLAVAAEQYEAAVAVVVERLREEVAAAELALRGHRGWVMGDG